MEPVRVSYWQQWDPKEARRYVSCTIKQAYSEEAAEDVRKYCSGRSRVRLYKYCCEFCGFWHLTKKGRPNCEDEAS